MADIINETHTPAPASPQSQRVAAVVINSKSGALLGQGDPVETLTKSFEAAGLTPLFFPPEIGDLPRRVEAACASGAAFLVVAGGDGTVACAAQLMAKTDMILGIIPMGTMNVLARDLSIPVGDVDAAIRVLAEGEIRRIDMGEVNGHVFLCGSMLGLPARLARYREAGRGGGSPAKLWSGFARAALRGIARYRAMRLRITVDGRPVRLRASALTIVPGELDNGVGRPLARSAIDSGVFHLYAVERIRLRDVLRLAIQSVLGGWRANPSIVEHEGRSIDIVSRKTALRVMNDGEVSLIAPPLSYRLRPRALAVMAPRP